MRHRAEPSGIRHFRLGVDLRLYRAGSGVGSRHRTCPRPSVPDATPACSGPDWSVVTDPSKTSYARSSDGTSVAYQTLGQGRGDLLLMGGGPYSIDSTDDEPSLARFQRQLASFCRLARYDTRGSGLSDPVSPASPPTLEDWMDDALAVMDAVSPAPWSLLGAQFGAIHAIMMAAAHPERVRSLVIVNGTARLVAADDYPIGRPRRDIRARLSTPAQSFDSATYLAVQRQYLSRSAPSAVDNEA